MNPEARLEQKFNVGIRLAGGRCIKLAPTAAGIPDRLVMFPANQFYLVELKTVNGRVSPIQAHWHEEIDKLGITVHVLYGEDQIRNWISWAADEAHENTIHGEAIDSRRRRMARRAARRGETG